MNTDWKRARRIYKHFRKSTPRRAEHSDRARHGARSPQRFHAPLTSPLRKLPHRYGHLNSGRFLTLRLLLRQTRVLRGHTAPARRPAALAELWHGADRSSERRRAKERPLPVDKCGTQHQTARPPRAASPRLHTRGPAPPPTPPASAGDGPPPPTKHDAAAEGSPRVPLPLRKGTLPSTLRLLPGSRHAAHGADSPAGTRCQVGPRPAARGSGGAVRAARGGDTRAAPPAAPRARPAPPPRSAPQRCSPPPRGADGRRAAAGRATARGKLAGANGDACCGRKSHGIYEVGSPRSSSPARQYCLLCHICRAPEHLRGRWHRHDWAAVPIKHQDVLETVFVVRWQTYIQ